MERELQRYRGRTVELISMDRHGKFSKRMVELQGDGRWESPQMVLPEHQEQYWQRRRQQTGRQPPTLTVEEIGLIRDYVLLPIMLAVVEKNAGEIGLSAYPLKPLYAAASVALIRRLLGDLHQIKKTLRRHDIQVLEETKVDSAIHYRLLCRGYEGAFDMMRDVVRSEMSQRLAQYIAGLFRPKELH
jgi:hypothetical protein